ncbi:hypothetical protein [Nonomuraea soli]|uniref:Uncharacterized protein n=1 Tax=Nonomuraea soli TaxID=1032476 RepID=A0A7W0CU12_9ACTN|nr:hypothetical protein [Nonomuraea soli]MBA2897125.1 hypothetical protein [Nonomuraea soli]
MLETHLREAMAERTAHLQAAHDLADRVVRLSRRRRRARLQVAAVAAALVALTGYLVIEPPAAPQAASPTSMASPIPGVEFGFLPAGLGAPVREGDVVRWGESVTVTVYENRSEALDYAGLRKLEQVSDPDPLPLLHSGHLAVVSQDRSQVFWQPHPTRLVKVTAPAGQAERIAAGMRFTNLGDSAADVIRLGYVPRGLTLSTKQPQKDTPWLAYPAWEGGQGRWLWLSSARGSQVESLDPVIAQLGGVYTGLERVEWRGKQAYLADFATSGYRGRALLWLEEPGVAFVLAAGGGAEKELDRIMAGVQRIDPHGEDVDGVAVPRGRPQGPVKRTLHDRRTSSTRTWTGGTTVTVHRGSGLPEHAGNGCTLERLGLAVVVETCGK